MAEKPDDIKILVTNRPENPENKSILRTPTGEANLEVVSMSIYSQVGIRVLRTYLQSLLGFILALGSGAADAVGISLPAGQFGGIFLQAASLAAAPAIISLLQNAVEILAKLDVTNPQVRA